jgi:hypothetical protein
VLDLEEFRRGDYDTGLLARAADRLFPTKAPSTELTTSQQIALAAAAIWQLEQDSRIALDPSRPNGEQRESAWALAGRRDALRRGP